MSPNYARHENSAISFANKDLLRVLAERQGTILFQGCGQQPHASDISSSVS